MLAEQRYLCQLQPAGLIAALRSAEGASVPTLNRSAAIEAVRNKAAMAAALTGPGFHRLGLGLHPPGRVRGT